MTEVPNIWGGHLLKLSHNGLKGWKKRYFLLEEGRLSYYDKININKIKLINYKPQGIKPLSTTSLNQATLQYIENADTSELTRHHFYLHNNENELDLTLGINNINEAKEWKEYFEKHINYATNYPNLIKQPEEVVRRVSGIFRSKHSSTDHSDVTSVSSFGSASTEGGSSRIFGGFTKKKRQSRGVEVDWGDGTGWNEAIHINSNSIHNTNNNIPTNSNTGSVPFTTEALSQHTLLLQQQTQQVQTSGQQQNQLSYNPGILNEKKTSDVDPVNDLSLVTEFPCESENQIPSRQNSSDSLKSKTLILMRSESAPDTQPTQPVDPETKKKRSKSFVPRFGFPPLPPSSQQQQQQQQSNTSSQLDIPSPINEVDTESNKLENNDIFSDTNPNSTREPPPLSPRGSTPEKKKERKSLLGKLGLGKSNSAQSATTSSSHQNNENQQQSQSQPQSQLQPEIQHSKDEIGIAPSRSRSNSNDSTAAEVKKKRTSGLLDRLGLHSKSEQPTETQPQTVSPSNLPHRYCVNLVVLLPHGTFSYAMPNSDSRLLVKLRKINCGDIIPVHAMKILDRKHWYETNNGWIEGAYNDKTNKIPQTRGLMYCLSGIPTRSKVLKLHFMEVVKKGWFRNATTYETEFILEVYFMSPNTGIESSLIRIRRSFLSLKSLQESLILKYPELAWKLFDVALHGFPVVTDGIIAIIEDPDRTLQLMEAMTEWFSAVLSKIDLMSCEELSHFLRPNEIDCDMMDIDLSATGGLNGAW